MSKYYIVEGSSTGTGRKYFQVFIGGMTIGDPSLTREEAEGLVQILEKRDADALAEREAAAEAPRPQSRGPRF